MRYINRNDLLIIVKNMGLLMIGIGFLCLVPIVIDFIYFECHAVEYLVPALGSIFLGLLCEKSLGDRELGKMKSKHAMIISSISWLWAGLVCGLILYFITGISLVDAIFESVSALTGSGITIYPDVESLPQSVLFFRGFQQWVGGLGVVVLLIFVLSKPGVVSSKLYQSEAREDRLRPSTKATIKHSIQIYLIYTVLGIVLYVLAGMPLFDSICNTFSIISTGGMSIKNANIGFYQDNLIYSITMFLMILGATSFLIHFNLIRTRGRSIINDIQLRLMLCLIAVSFLLIYFSSQIVPMDILFSVVSAVTTTGASIQSATVMGGWPSFAIFIIMVLMLVGGSNGSTVGAIKLMRIIVFFKGIYKNTLEIVSPEGTVVPIKIANQRLKESVVARSGNYITIYLLFVLVSWFSLCLFGHDSFDSLFFAISMQGNVGLEIGQVSLALEWPLKVMGIFSMWAGRLEIYPVLITLRVLFEVFKK